MKSRLSAFIDGELPSGELDDLLAEIGSSESAETWRRYEFTHAVVSDENIRLSHSELYDAGLTSRIMRQVEGEAPLSVASQPDAESPSAARSADVIPFPTRLRRWAMPASVAASAAAAALYMGVFDASAPEQIARNVTANPSPVVASGPVSSNTPVSGVMTVASAPMSSPSLASSSISAPERIAEQAGTSPNMLLRPGEPVENQVIPELNEFILQHNSIASSRHFQPTLSYVRVVSHNGR